MANKVDGYMTKHGRFHNTRQQAEYDEAKTDLESKLKNILQDDSNVRRQMGLMFLAFNEVGDFIEALKALDEETREIVFKESTPISIALGREERVARPLPSASPPRRTPDPERSRHAPVINAQLVPVGDLSLVEEALSELSEFNLNLLGSDPLEPGQRED